MPFDITIDDELLDKCDIAMPYMVSTKGSLNGVVDNDDKDIVVLRKLKDGDTAQHGNFQLGDDSSSNLPAQRWYMTKTSKSDAAPLLAKAIRLLTLGEDGEATAIVAARAEKMANTVIYSPTGVRLAQPQKGLNIVNGRKVLIK